MLDGRHAAHLARRFAGMLSNAPPPAADEAWASTQLDVAELALWARLGNADRRHAVAVARRFVARRPGATRAEVAGALLHDVGKLASAFGVAGRVIATVVGPRGRRLRAYHDHEDLGAEMLREAGSDAATIELVSGQGPAIADLRAADDV